MNEQVQLDESALTPSHVRAFSARAEAHFGAKVSVLVNNALQSYKFDPTSPSASLKTVSWETIDAQMRGTVQGAGQESSEKNPRA